MMINKNIVHLFFFFNKKTSNLNFFTLSIIYSHIFKQSFIQYVGLNTIFLFTKTHISFNYRYHIKIIIPNWIIFNSILISLFKFFKSMTIKTKLKFNFLKKKKNYFTVIRSPFKYKKSREYLYNEYFIGHVAINIYSKPTYLKINFIEFLLSKIFSN